MKVMLHCVSCSMEIYEFNITHIANCFKSSFLFPVAKIFLTKKEQSKFLPFVLCKSRLHVLYYGSAGHSAPAAK